jgi:hypothetical protein
MVPGARDRPHLHGFVLRIEVIQTNVTTEKYKK